MCHPQRYSLRRFPLRRCMAQCRNVPLVAQQTAALAQYHDVPHATADCGAYDCGAAWHNATMCHRQRSRQRRLIIAALHGLMLAGRKTYFRSQNSPCCLSWHTDFEHFPCRQSRCGSRSSHARPSISSPLRRHRPQFSRSHRSPLGLKIQDFIGIT